MHTKNKTKWGLLEFHNLKTNKQTKLTIRQFKITKVKVYKWNKTMQVAVKHRFWGRLGAQTLLIFLLSIASVQAFVLLLLILGSASSIIQSVNQRLLRNRPGSGCSDLSRLLARKIAKDIHSCKPASLPNTSVFPYARSCILRRVVIFLHCNSRSPGLHFSFKVNKRHSLRTVCY